jgi:hypothetical protein
LQCGGLVQETSPPPPFRHKRMDSWLMSINTLAYVVYQCQQVELTGAQCRSSGNKRQRDNHASDDLLLVGTRLHIFVYNFFALSSKLLVAVPVLSSHVLLKA